MGRLPAVVLIVALAFRVAIGSRSRPIAVFCSSWERMICLFSSLLSTRNGIANAIVKDDRCSHMTAR